MTSDDRNQLLQRIRELESEVADRERDLAHFRHELSTANSRLESLIGQLNQELKLAHSIQKSLVPTEFPSIQGFEFSTKFVASHLSGGDYFDIFEHEDRLKFGVIVASSSGHTLSALFLSVLLKMTGQLEARRGTEPHKVLEKMAAEIVPQIQGAGTADVFYGVIDRRHYEMTFCRVGQMVTLHQNFSTGEVQLLDPAAEAFSVHFGNVKLSSHKVTLQPRDRLILCTRGVIEAKDLNGEVFGLERLVKAIHEAPKQGVHELRNQILYSAQKYSGGQEPQRDMTAVVLEVKDRVIKLAQH